MSLKNKRVAGQWGSSKRYSAFAKRPREWTPGEHHYVKIPLVRYCEEKNISRAQALRLIDKKLLAVTKLKRRLWVHEVCPEQITLALNGFGGDYPSNP